MRLSRAFACFVAVATSIVLVTSADAQNMISKEAMIPGPLQDWQTNAEQRLSQTLVSSAETKSIAIDVAILKVDPKCDVSLKSFFKPGTFEVHTGAIPAVDWNAELGESRKSTGDKPEKSSIRFATSCDSVRKTLPVMLAKLDDAGVDALKQSLSDQTITNAPTATCHSGFPATIHDIQQRPFVVGVKPVVNSKSIAHQPVIQTIEDGTVLRFQPTESNGSIELNASIAHSTVSNVETLQISGNESQGVVIQIPEQTLKQVRLGATLEDGETLFIDPRLQIRTEEQHKLKKRPFVKPKTQVEVVHKNVYLLVKTRIVSQPREYATKLTHVQK